MITDTFATFSILVILHHTGNNFLQLLRYLCECSKFVVIGPVGSSVPFCCGCYVY